MEPASRPNDAARALLDLHAGDPKAVERLLPLIYDELRALAAAYLRHERKDHTLQPTALVHEAWLRLVGGQGLEALDRTRFFRLGAQAIRRVLVDHARAHDARKRGGGAARVSLSEDLALVAAPELDLLALDDALVALSRLDERQAHVVELRFFGGLSVGEVARLLDVSPRTVEGDWHMARAFLRRELGGGSPSGRA